MKPTLPLSVWLAFLIFCLGCQQSRDYSQDQKTEETTAENQYKVIAIKDGDTIELLKDGKPLRIRLQGVDCPEKNQDFGTRARQFTSDLVFGKSVGLVVHDIDRYGRTVGEIILPDGRNLNHELVKEGFAWHYTAYSKDPELARLEAEARAAKKGLWEQPSPQAPWDFRKNRGNAASGANVSSGAKKSTAATPKTASTTSATTSSKNGKAYFCESKGATTYHLDPNCNRLKQCKSGTGTITVAQARKQDRTPCKVCS
ncbi:thermonuclease family protein [Rufibacter sp. H-1]|uniref:Thermonuclease family protein n=1 Tax=Rufibacter sediminis TaxID=2762756 RepID=A0ABR6VYD6_9BACT|nr:thermonuclease family protein [Rufibacter sediminis]MBC3542113.1 thermonuclease family protein [Rufibacter sediminis]